MVNMLMLGNAYEKGLLPLRESSMMEAIEVNGTMVDVNKKAWFFGRYLATDEGIAKINKAINFTPVETATGAFNDRFMRLIKYQGTSYAQEYLNLVKKAKAIDASLNKTEFSDAVMHNLYKLMAYKDEYEVARIWSETLNRFNNDFYEIKGVNFHMSLPWQRKSKRKTRLPGYTKVFFNMLKHGKKLRGTKFDLLGYSYERKLERKIRDHYIYLIYQWFSEIKESNYERIVDLAKEPENIRGFGYIKLNSIKQSALFNKLL